MSSGKIAYTNPSAVESNTPVELPTRTSSEIRSLLRLVIRVVDPMMGIIVNRNCGRKIFFFPIYGGVPVTVFFFLSNELAWKRFLAKASLSTKYCGILYYYYGIYTRISVPYIASASKF